MQHQPSHISYTCIVLSKLDNKKLVPDLKYKDLLLVFVIHVCK